MDERDYLICGCPPESVPRPPNDESVLRWSPGPTEVGPGVILVQDLTIRMLNCGGGVYGSKP